MQLSKAGRNRRNGSLRQRCRTGRRQQVWRSIGWSLAVLFLWPADSTAQLEVLLRGIEPMLPQEGVCAVYQFDAQEPDGERHSTFIACVESVPQEGPVILRLSAGDSLQVRLEVGRAMFTQPGALLSENILSVERTENGEVQRLTPEDWQKHPALAPAAPLPVVADSSTGGRSFTLPDGRELHTSGRYRRELRSADRTLGDVLVTTREDRQLDIWTADEAPILGVVMAVATVRSERVFSEPIPGVPERGPRVMHYSLKLLEILQHGAR